MDNQKTDTLIKFKTKYYLTIKGFDIDVGGER